MNNRRVTFSKENEIHFIPKLSAKFHHVKATKYDPQNCEICKISCNSKKIYEMHINGKKHLKALDKFKETNFPCGICFLNFDDIESWSDHMKSLEHMKSEQKQFSTRVFDVISQNTVNTINYCDVCKLDCGSNIILQSHLTGSKHKRKAKLIVIEKLKEKKDSSVFCDICEITLEPELMLLHKKSNKHKKKNVPKKVNITTQKSKKGLEYCAICDEDLPNFNGAIEHYKSSEHAENLRNSENNSLWCDVCKILLPDKPIFDSHIQGFSHYRILNREELPLEGTFKDKVLIRREIKRQLRQQFMLEKSQTLASENS